MKKLFYYAFMMLTMASATSALTSCGDDDDDNPVQEGNEKFSIVGKWKTVFSDLDPEETSEALTNLELYSIFNADNTYESYEVLPAEIIKKLPESQQAKYDKDGIYCKTRGTYVLRNDSIITTEAEAYFYEEYNDWEWHKSVDTNSVKITNIDNSKQTFTVSFTEMGKTYTTTLQRVK